MYAALTTTFWLSITVPAAAWATLIAFGGVRRRHGVLALGILGLLATLGWLILGLYVEAVIE